MTSPLAGRRSLYYHPMPDVLDDAEKQASRQAATCGNWSMGQIFEHLARSIERSIDGFDFQAPLAWRLIGKYIMKKKLLKKMSPGLRLKGKVAEVLLPPQTTTEAGL